MSFKELHLESSYPLSQEGAKQVLHSLAEEARNCRIILGGPAPQSLREGLIATCCSGAKVQVLIRRPVDSSSATSTRVAESHGSYESKPSLLPELSAAENEGRLQIRWLPLVENNSSGDISSYAILEDGEEQVGLNAGNTDYLCGDAEQTAHLSWSWGDPMAKLNGLVTAFDEQWSEATDGSIADIDLSGSAEIDITDENTEIELFPHQKAGLENWESNGFHGIFKMCTGAGKTIASLEGVKRLAACLKVNDDALGTVVITVPTRVLVEQWEKEIIAYGLPKPLLAYESVRNYIARLGAALDNSGCGNIHVVLTTYASFGQPAFRNQVRMASENGSEALLIADEVHNCVSRSRLNQTLTSASGYFKYRLGLSATPEIEGDDSGTTALFDYFGGVQGTFELREAIDSGVLCEYLYYPKPVFLDPESSVRYFDLLGSIDRGKPVSGVSLVELQRRRREMIRQSDIYVPALEEILSSISSKGESIERLLVYCPAGKQDAASDTRILGSIKQLFTKQSILTSSITARVTSSMERADILKKFESRYFKVLLGIGCLDEGVNVPAIKRAIMLYSIDKERQFVQRRGRILRKHSDKEYAVIDDLIVLPHNSGMRNSDAERLLEKELRRYREFAKTAKNAEEARVIIEQALASAAGGEYV